MRRAVLLAIAMLFSSGALFPCGGPVRAEIDAPLVPAPVFAQQLLYPFDGIGVDVRKELRFTYALRLADSARFATLDDLVRLQYGFTADTAEPSPVDTLLLARAIESNDVAHAAREARRVVDELLALPAPIASNGALALRRAVELLDFVPTLEAAPGAPISAVLASSGAIVRRLTPADLDAFVTAHPTHPRIAAVRLLQLHHHIRTRVPDGWMSDVRALVSPMLWIALQEEHAAWLADYPSHPLAPLVKAQRVRLWYYEGRQAEAWDALRDLYRTHPARAAYEMRHLLVLGLHPPEGILLDESFPIELRIALIGTLVPSTNEWSGLWEASKRQKSAALAVNLQERLLAAAAGDSVADDGVAPAALPPYQPSANQLWRQLWAIAQLRAGDAAAATELAAPQEADSTGVTSAILTRAHLELGRWSRAIVTPGLQADARRYLMHVLAEDSVLAVLQAQPDSIVRREALQASAARAANGGNWMAAAELLAPFDRPRAAALRQAAMLARDSSVAGTLAFARWLASKRHALFRVSDDDVIWYRSVSNRRSWLQFTLTEFPDATSGLPWSIADESAAIERHFRATSEDWHALVQYRRFFDATRGGHPLRSAAVREANAAYRRLVDYGRQDGLFWAEVLPTSPEAVAIRQAGRGR